MPVCDQLAVFASQPFKEQLQAPADCTLYNGLSKKTDMDGLQWNQETTKDYHISFMKFFVQIQKGTIW